MLPCTRLASWRRAYGNTLNPAVLGGLKPGGVGPILHRLYSVSERPLESSSCVAMISSVLFKVAFAVSFIVSSGAAVPLTSDGPSCQPNFENVGVSVVNGGVEWATESNPVPGTMILNRAVTYDHPEFYFAFNGAPTNAYNIRPDQVPENSELVISSVVSEFLTLEHEDLAWPSDPLQSFIVQCETCLQGASKFTGQYATGCTISPAGRPNDCYETTGVIGDVLFSNNCTGVDGQRFDFWTVA